MNLTLKNKAAEHRAILEKITKLQFDSECSISKQLKDIVEDSRQRYFTNANKSSHFGTRRGTQKLQINPNPQIFSKGAENKVSKIKFIGHKKMPLGDQPHRTFNQLKFFKSSHEQKEEHFPHKMSVETAVSTTLSKDNSDRKRPLSLNAIENNITIKQQLAQLKQKNSVYTIRWRSPASNISKSMRVILGQWLMQLAHEIQVPKNAVYNAMHYLDKYVGMVHISRKNYQKLGLCALFIASKLQVSSHPRIDTYIQAMEGSCSRKQIIALEQEMVLKLKFRLNPPTLYQYMVLVVSLFNNFIKKSHIEEFHELCLASDSEGYKYLFWVLDGIHLEDSYKSFHNKEKVCLSVLYMVLKKQKSSSKKRCLSQLESLKLGGPLESIFEEFLFEVIRIFSKLNDLKECIRGVRKWAKYDRKRGPQQQNIQLLKTIIINQEI